MESYASFQRKRAVLPKEQSAQSDTAALGAVRGFGLAQVIIRNGGICTCSAKHSEVHL